MESSSLKDLCKISIKCVASNLFKRRTFTFQKTTDYLTDIRVLFFKVTSTESRGTRPHDEVDIALQRLENGLCRYLPYIPTYLLLSLLWLTFIIAVFVFACGYAITLYNLCTYCCYVSLSWPCNMGSIK